MTTQESTLHVKLALIRSAFGPIFKTGQNRGVGDGYKFVETTVVTSRLLELFGQHGITMLPVDSEIVDIRPSVSGKMVVYTLRVTWRVTDAATGEWITVQSYGQGADNADKALPKAQTNALKYGVLLLLQRAGDDAEADASVDRTEHSQLHIEPAPSVPAAPQLATDATKRMIRARGREAGLTDESLKALVVWRLGAPKSSKEWTTVDADAIIESLADPAVVEVFRDPELLAAS